MCWDLAAQERWPHVSPTCAQCGEGVQVRQDNQQCKLSLTGLQCSLGLQQPVRLLGDGLFISASVLLSVLCGALDKAKASQCFQI